MVNTILARRVNHIVAKGDNPAWPKGSKSRGFSNTATDISFKGNSAAGATVRATPARDFYFEFRREGDTMTHDAVAKDREWSYTYGQMANIGTIFHLYGGEWMKKLDLGDWGGFTDMSLPNLPVLEELVLGNSSKTYALTELVLGTKLPMLRKLDVANYTNLPSLDLSGCNRLEEVNASGCTALSTITFAEGAAVNRLHLPANFQTLTLRSMQYIKWSAITFDNKRNLTGIWIENCALIDGLSVFKELFSLGGRLKYVRITGLELEGDGGDLKEWYDASLGGFDASGNTTNTRCKLVGTYRLTKYLDEAEYQKYVERFDELNIRQPQYTMIEFDDTVSDDANISNPDNETGYKYGNQYVPSAHVAAILRQRHRVLGKQAVKGTMTIVQLDDADSNKYADGTAAKLDGTEGDVFVYEPHYWYKGVNDYLRNRKYACFSSRDEMPDRPECTVITFEELRDGGSIDSGMKVQTGKADVQSSLTSDSNYSAVTVSVSGYKRVRFPSVVGSSLVGAVFADDTGTVVKSVIVETLNARFVDGMYLISDVPDGATRLHFSIRNTSDFDCVVLSNSDKIEDMEPDWVEHEACLCGAFQAVTIGSKLYSAINGATSVASLTQPDMVYYANQRGLQLVDWEMNKDVANLFYAKYGRRDAQDQCGYGQNTNARIIGTTSILGMADTVNPDHKTEWCWYKTQDEYGSDKYVQIASCNCLGYENWFGNKAEWMDKVSLPNSPSSEQYKLYIEMPDGTTRKVKSTTTSGFMTAVVHQKWMDIVSAAGAGSSTTYYCDEFVPSGSTGRVVFRSGSYANASAGVGRAYCGNDSSYANASIGSRLAFRGKIEVAESVGAFKSLSVPEEYA